MIVGTGCVRDVKTGKIYFTKATRERLGPQFAKAGYDIRRIHTLEEALQAWFDSLSEKAQQMVIEALEERRRELEEQKARQ